MIAKLNGTINSHEARAALEKILASPDFKANRNSTEFLKYIVKETLEGRGDRLKGYSIGTAALGRKADFDPQANSIVRVQAIRLRKQLDEYYAGPGADDPMRIGLPLGTYRPSFELRAEESEALEPQAGGAAEPAAPAKPPVGATKRGSSWFWIAGAIAAVLVLVAGALALAWSLARVPETSGGPDDDSGEPYVTIRASAFDGESAPLRTFTNNLAAELENRFSAFDNIGVRTDARAGRSSSEGASAGADYQLVVTPQNAVAGPPDFLLRLTRSKSGTVVWTKTYRSIDILDPKARTAIVADAAFAIADLYGIVDADMRKQLEESDPQQARGYACALLAFDYIRTLAPEARALALHCLEAGVARQPGAKKTALLAIVLVRGYVNAVPGSNGRADLERALDLARTAYETAPFRARSLFVYFLTRFYNGQFDEAFTAAEKALEINPYSATIVAAIGSGYVARGDYARGMALLKDLAHLDSTAPVGFLSYGALAAYMQDDDTELSKYSDRTALSRSALGILMRTIIGERGLGPRCVEACAQRLAADFPGFAANIPAALDRNAFAEPIKARLLADLKASGLLDAVEALHPEAGTGGAPAPSP